MQRVAINPSPVSLSGWLGATWASVGISLLLGQALVRLAPMAIQAINGGLKLWHWPILLVWVAIMAVSEGYRGFQQNFSPRFAARAQWLLHHPRPLAVALAPLFCMGFFGSTRKRKIVSTCLTLGVVALVVLVRMMPQPWRGIIDAGVVVGLGWGLVSLWACLFQTLVQRRDLGDGEVVWGRA